jgi:hypothetical protein
MSTQTRSDHRTLRLAVVAGLLALALGAPTSARGDDDPMAPYRERFQSGMTHYKSGDYAGAVAWWEPIVTALGDDKGYRVAFDLARAYEKLGDPGHARARYESFVRVVEAKRAHGESIDEVVDKEETEARASLGPEPAASPAPVPTPPAATSAATTTPAPSSPAAATPPAAPPAPARAITHPFSPWLLVAGGALTTGAGIVCGVEYASALGKKSDFNAAPPATQGTIQSSYDGVRSVAYVSLAATAGFAAITGALTAWYLAASGSGKESGAVSVAALPTPHGSEIGLAGRF